MHLVFYQLSTYHVQKSCLFFINCNINFHISLYLHKQIDNICVSGSYNLYKLLDLGILRTI